VQEVAREAMEKTIARTKINRSMANILLLVVLL
jgi:hypothetical protein